MTHILPELTYSYNSLEPHIDARTMEIHHTKHHQTYIDNLNKAIKGKVDLENKDVESLISDLQSVPEDIRSIVRNNGGGHANHSLFWKVKAKAGGMPVGQVEEDIKKVFGSFDTFRVKFAQAAMTRFGSGWAWLSVTKEGELEISSTANQDSPIMEGKTPLLGIDVWEHAYYLHYQNRRSDYIAAFWNVVNWKEVDRILESVSKTKQVKLFG